MPDNLSDHACREIDEERIYPAEYHFRIIADPAEHVPRAIGAILNDYDIVEPLRRGHLSRGGRYQTLQVTVRLRNRAEHHALDLRLRKSEGVRLLL